LISQRYFKWAFWLGWVLNLGLALYLTVILIWLEFFWHSQPGLRTITSLRKAQFHCCPSTHA
jgi:hypothetical protein